MAEVMPNPVARKINREAVVLFGWGRAVLLQLAHPLIAAGVGEYSGFREGAGGYLKRVRGTVGAMLDLTFGTPDEARRIVARIDGIHGHVHGTLREQVGLFPAGTPYSARDPLLLCWVHCTLLESMVIAYERFVGPLTAAEKDAYVAEAAWVAHELGAGTDVVPTTYAGVERFMADRHERGEITVGDQARRLGGALLSPPLGPMAPLFRLSRVITVGLLPENVRAGYAFPWDADRARAFARAVSFVRGVRRLLPGVLSEFPAARKVA